MGAPWYKWCPWVRDLKYLYKTEGLTESFAEAWTVRKQWVIDGNSSQHGAAVKNVQSVLSVADTDRALVAAVSTASAPQDTRVGS
eukprot:8105984-Pyramimonas_sp.AAC.1